MVWRGQTDTHITHTHKLHKPHFKYIKHHPQSKNVQTCYDKNWFCRCLITSGVRSAVVGTEEVWSITRGLRWMLQTCRQGGAHSLKGPMRDQQTFRLGTPWQIMPLNYINLLNIVTYSLLSWCIPQLAVQIEQLLQVGAGKPAAKESSAGRCSTWGQNLDTTNHCQHLYADAGL